MSYRAHIHDLTTGCFLLRFIVEAHDLHEAENTAILKAALALRALPQEMEVRRLHQCSLRETEAMKNPNAFV